MSNKHRSKGRDPFSHSAFLSSSGISLDKDGLIHRSAREGTHNASRRSQVPSTGNETGISMENASLIDKASQMSKVAVDGGRHERHHSRHRTTNTTNSTSTIIRRDKRDRSYTTYKSDIQTISSPLSSASAISKHTSSSINRNEETKKMPTPRSTASTSASSNTTSNISTWQLERYQKAKLRSRQGAVSRQSNQHATHMKNRSKQGKELESQIPSITKSTSNATSTTNTLKPNAKSKIFEKNDYVQERNDSKTSKQKIYISSDVSSTSIDPQPSPVLKQLDCNSPRLSKKNILNEIRGHKPKVMKLDTDVKSGNTTNTKSMTDRASSPCQTGKRLYNSSSTKENEQRKTAEQDLEERDEDFDAFMRELKKEVSVDHTQLWESFQQMLGCENTGLALYAESCENESERDKTKRRKRARLGSVSQKHLQSIHRSLSKQVSSSHLASKSQLLDDKALALQHKRSRKNNNQSVSSEKRKHDERAKQKTSHGQERKMKPKKKTTAESALQLPTVITISDQIDDILVSDTNQRHQNGTDDSLDCDPLDRRIEDRDMQESREKRWCLSDKCLIDEVDDGSSSDDAELCVSKSSEKRSIPSNDQKQDQGHLPSTSSIKAIVENDPSTQKSMSLLPSVNSTRPPLPPQPKAPEKPKKSMSWLSALREKQKRRKNDSKKSDDDKSVSTTDLETSAADAVGKSKVISIFGKHVSLTSRGTTQKVSDCEEECGQSSNTSPWNVKLRPVSAERPTQFREEPLVSSRDVQIKRVSTAHSSIPYTPDKGHFLPTLNPTPTKEICSISLGDTINLSDLPKSEFHGNSDVTIMPLSNNAGSQVIVVGKDLVLIATRLANHAEEGSVDDDKAIVLWRTYRKCIQSLTLNPEGTGALISVTDGPSYPLTFEDPGKFFAFTQAFYQIESATPMENNTNEALVAKQTSDASAMKQPTSDSESPQPQHRVSDESREKNNYTVNHGSNMPDCSKEKDEASIDVDRKSEDGDSRLGSVHLQLLNSLKLKVKHSVESDETDQSDSGEIKTEANSSAPLKLNEDEEKAANKYRKMLRMFIPKDAVRQKMVMEEASDKVMAAVLGKEDLDSGNISTTNNANEQPQGLDTSQEGIASTYRKMLKVGLPPEAVRHKMKKDNVSNDIVNSVLGQLEACSDTPEQEASLSGEDEEEASKYRKMLKYGIPQDAVRHEMLKDGVSTRIVEAVVGHKAQAPTSHFGNDKQDNSIQPASLSDEEEEKANKYRKMLKYGIPQDAVRCEMLKDDVALRIVEAVVGRDKQTEKSKDEPSLSEEEEAAVVKYRKFLKNGVPIDAVRHKMTSDQVSDKVANAVLGSHNTTIVSVKKPKDLSGVKRKSRFMGLHWTPLSEEDINKTANIFNSTKKRKGDAAIEPGSVDLSKLEELFQKKTTKPNGINIRKSGEDEKQKAKLIKLERAQNVSIQLHKFKDFTHDELVTLINDLDPERKIQGERLQFLKGLLPLDEEVRSLEGYKGDESRLVPAEIFLRKLLSVKRVRNKVSIIQTMGMFSQSADEVISQFNMLMAVSSDIMRSEKLQLVLEAVLTIGNIMNEGTRTGGAAGFKFESLLRLTQTKSMDGKMTVLDYIVQMFISKGERNVLNLSDEFPDCPEASRILITDIIINSTALRKSLNECRSELIEMTNEQSSKPVTRSMKKEVEKQATGDPKELLFAEILSRRSGKDENRHNEHNTVVDLELSPGVTQLKSFVNKASQEMNHVEKVQKRAIQSCKDLATYCGEDGDQRAATTVLGVLTEFIACMEQALKKHDSMKKTEAKKDATRKAKNAMASVVKPKGKESDKSESDSSSAKIASSSEEETLRGNNESSCNAIDARQEMLNSILNRRSHKSLEETDKLPSRRNAIDARQAMLQSILRRNEKQELHILKPPKPESIHIESSMIHSTDDGKEEDNVIVESAKSLVCGVLPSITD